MYICIGDLPQMYSNLPYDMHTVMVQAVSDSVNITIVQKGKFYININCIIIKYFYSVNGDGRHWYI